MLRLREAVGSSVTIDNTRAVYLRDTEKSKPTEMIRWDEFLRRVAS